MIRLFFFIFVLIGCVGFYSGCASSFLKIDKKEEDFVKNVEFDEKVKIKDLAEDASEGSNPVAEIPVTSLNPAPGKIVTPTPLEKTPKGKNKKNKKNSKDKLDIKAIGNTPDKDEAPAVANPAPVNLSEVEDQEGMNGRRPIKDPFRVGEEVIHEMHYFKVAAGELRLKVGPFVEVNGKRSYTFKTELESSSMFSSFYSVKDTATTYVDYMQFVPHVFTLGVKETGQIKDAKGLFDIENNKATYWEKKFTKKNGHEETKKEWDILPFSQNVYSAAFYMRLFKWEVGKEYAFRVADAGENIVFRGKAIRKEKIKTEVGDFDAIVIKPEITVKGIFKPIGDIYFWLSDDDRKYILRIESSIKIGTIISEVVKIKPGGK